MGGQVGANMWVFVKGIPRGMDSKGLEKLIKKLLRPAWSPFSLSGRISISGAKILKIVHTRSRSTEYHGLIRVKPEERVRSVIEKINRAKVDGRNLECHPYSNRYTKRDRRKLLLDDPHDSNERRRAERRRRNLVSQVIDAKL
jgi:hypothetical protein